MGPPWFSGATHKEPPCFAAERGPDTHEHSRVHFLILSPGDRV